jgi:hypothetical protein
MPPGISTDSARGPETTGNNRADPDKRHREWTASLTSETARPQVNGRYIRSSGLPYVQSSHGPPDNHPLDFAGALEDGEDPGGTGSLRRSAACTTPYISTDPARAVRGVWRFAFGPRLFSSVVRMHAEKTRESSGCFFRQNIPPQVHYRADMQVSVVLDAHPSVRAAARGRDPGINGQNGFAA